MNEGNLEAEIAALSQQIEQKRSQLESEKGFVPESREALQEVVKESVYGDVANASGATGDDDGDSKSQTKSGTHYLDNLEGENIERVNELIEDLDKSGLKKTIEKAKSEDPFVLDAFHDALVDRLYGELKNRGHLK